MQISLKATARALALVAVLTFATAAPASAVSPTTYQGQVVTATNAYRTAKGLAPVKAQKCLHRWAASQARWMARTTTLQHRPGRLLKVMKSCKLRAASENIAFRFSSGTKVVQAWSRSPGHAANMSAAKAQYVGVAAVRAKGGTWYVAELFGSRR